jgi:hypothetical protein
MKALNYSVSCFECMSSDSRRKREVIDHRWPRRFRHNAPHFRWNKVWVPRLGNNEEVRQILTIDRLWSRLKHKAGGAYDGLDHQPNVPRQVGDGHQDLEPQGGEESPSLPVPSAEEQEEASLLVRFYM